MKKIKQVIERTPKEMFVEEKKVQSEVERKRYRGKRKNRELRVNPFIRFCCLGVFKERS